MIALLLRLYPTRWRERYGDEFAAVLEERPLGPFDVADVLLGALDAHLNLRGLGAASHHAKGFAMTLRIGGWAAIVGGALWFIAMLGSAIVAGTGSEEGGELGVLLLLAGTIALLLALVGLSAFQARTHPVLTWAAFLVPAVGAAVSIVGMFGMAVLGDRPFLGLESPWYVWMLGTVTLLVGSALFAIATWRTHALARPAAVLLAAGAVVIVPALAGVTGATLPDPLGGILTLACFGMFGAGWVAIGISALRLDRPRPAGSGLAA